MSARHAYQTLATTGLSKSPAQIRSDRSVDNILLRLDLTSFILEAYGPFQTSLSFLKFSDQKDVVSDQDKANPVPTVLRYSGICLGRRLLLLIELITKRGDGQTTSPCVAGPLVKVKSIDHEEIEEDFAFNTLCGHERGCRGPPHGDRFLFFRLESVKMKRLLMREQ